MQAVIRQLKHDGFVRSVHRSGLFVADHPPHLHRFGLAFADHPGGENWNRFYGALLAESAVVARQHAGVEIVPFYGLKPDVENGERSRLREDLRHQRLAGLIVTGGTSFLLRAPERDEGLVPAVAINHSESVTSGAPVVNTDDPLLLTKAFAWLAERRRRRVAVVAMRSPTGATVERCAAAGLQTRPHWLCPIGHGYADQVRVVVRLLLDYPEAERPDALVVATDNLVEEALAAIHGTGLVIGRDLDVVAHCNWPWPVESPLPIARLGFHSHHFLHACLEAIRDQRQGRTPLHCKRVPALFEHEL